jgi:hypothetical protein
MNRLHKNIQAPATEASGSTQGKNSKKKLTESKLSANEKKRNKH